MRARSTRVESRLEACGECTSCNIGGTGSVGQKYRPSLTNSGCVSKKHVQRVQQLPLRLHPCAGRIIKMEGNVRHVVKQVSNFDGSKDADDGLGLCFYPLW